MSAQTQVPGSGIYSPAQPISEAGMVSNLLVVLCSEQATQQVVNTGSLYS